MVKENVPTILVGLGGIGSTIAHNIYGAIPEERRERVAIHAFDTDVNSIRKLAHLKDHVTQTSTNKSVGEYLHQNDSLLSWFPSSPYLRKKTMTEGAGQIRAVSRLAFRSAMADGKMNALWESIERIFPVQKEGTTYGVRVIIISSLVGGTGAGIYLQVAMYLREMLERKLGQSSVLIRGAFLLPDILVRSQALDQREWESVQANGYASLKELNAITRIASSSEEKNVTIELEYRPNQIDFEGRTTHAITDKQLPYDFCFLYDYENLKGEHLLSVSDYIDQVSQTIYLQLFSPISAKHFSQEDNQILELISSEGRGRYCGAGAASLTYPYENILDYSALRWAVSGLDDSWLMIDHVFEEERSRYELDLRKGINRKKLDRGERFTATFDQLVNDENPQPFFKEVEGHVREELPNGKHGQLKSSLFVAAVEERVKQVIKNDPELQAQSDQCVIDEGQMKLKEKVKREIGRVEASLAFYTDQIHRKVYEYRTFLHHQIVDQDYDNPSGGEGQGYRMNTWFLMKPEPVHPLGVRYLLYKMHKALKEKIETLREANTNMKRQVQRYDEIYDLRDTEEVEDAVRRMELALKQNLLSSVLNNQYKDFMKEYVEKASRHHTMLTKYSESLLLELVLVSVDQSIQGMIRDWERFFENLKDTRNTLLANINQLANKYEGRVNPTREYVLATKEFQEKMWGSIRQDLTSGSLPHSISKELYLSHYRHYCERSNARFASDYDKEMKVEELYRIHVLSHCKQELRERKNERLDLDIIQALRKEAEFLEKNPETHIAERIEHLDHLSSPFIPFIPEHRELKFWGIHTESAERLSEKQLFESFTDKEVADNAFSKYEIICYRAHYGLSVQHFQKFSSGEESKNHQQLPGVYFEAYRKRIGKLIRGEATVTPHLDKNWHLPAYMPDLNPSHARLEVSKADRAFLLGVIYKWIQLVNEEGRKVYQYHGNEGSRLILESGVVIGEELYRLHQALPHNPVIYDEILQRFQEKQAYEMKKHKDFMTHEFITGCLDVTSIQKDHLHNILDLGFLYESESLGDERLPAIGQRVRQVLLEEIEAYFIKMHGEHRRFKARNEAANFIEKLWNESHAKSTVEEDSADYSSWQNTVNLKLTSLKQEEVRNN